ncbi:MAG: tetratricopeptide repeat protein [Sedimentisphaerales bacterium]|nr:tetratricopeptide repeat protein [Sedimentisphaerales bacterium]
MVVLSLDINSILADNEPLSDEQYCQLVTKVRQGERQRLQFMQHLQEAIDNNGNQLSGNPVMSLKVAQGLFALGNYAESLNWLEKSGAGKQACYFKALVHKALGHYDQAIHEYEQAESKGWDSFDIAVSIVDCLRRAGKLEEAAERLKRISRVGDIRAEYHYQLAQLHKANGFYEEAIEECEKAVALDRNHTEALFFLAFNYDLYGLEEKAIGYYKQCINSDVPSVSALLNLAVLYEDAEDYTNALICIKRVLAAYPNHQRARMYLKDIESSLTMYYDEDQERKVDRRNKVLEIPISDFELSVRSRNCLRKMNIKTLSDLLKVTESELLAYKNFGETSLHEIKTILNSKGLRLGQMLEEHKNEIVKKPAKTSGPEGEDAVLETPVTQLEMSVRSRKCLERLNINTIGELINCTEAELLGCKNFGMTSLTEIKQSLKKHELTLRRLED